MSETDQENYLEEEIEESKKIIKLNKIGRILIYSSLIIVWSVTVGLGIRDLWQDKGILDTPWILFGLVLSVILIFVIVVPLFRSLKIDIHRYKKTKEQEEK